MQPRLTQPTLPALLAAALLAGCAGPDYEARCSQQGYSQGSAEYQNCLESLYAVDRKQRRQHLTRSPGGGGG